MEYIRDLKQYRAETDCVLTLGKFDGVHKGHKKLIRRVLEIAAENNWKTAVFTFAASPQAVLAHQEQNSLMTNEERFRYLESMGLDILVECPFTKEIRDMEPEDFVRNILVEKLHGKAVVAGTDFRFGRNRRGTPEFLREQGRELGFSVEIIEKEKDGIRDISSTCIREELQAGNMEKVTELLGYPYTVAGKIVHGRHLGRSIGIPTINQIPPEGRLLPPNGVYFSNARIGDRLWHGVTNLGSKPTVGGEGMTVETYLFGCEEDLYGREASVELLHFRRPEMKFPSVDALKARMESDLKAAEEWFARK